MGPWGSFLSLLLLQGVHLALSGHAPSLKERINRENMDILLDSSITIKVYPSTLSSTGGWVKVTWKYVDDPADNDWMGVYSPPTNDGYRINPSKHAPIHLLFANYSSSHLTSGRGYLQFKLVNMRAPVVFGFFRGGVEDATLVAVSDSVTFKNYNEPLQGHLALTGDPTEMALQWVTKNKKKPSVYYGTTSGSYDYVVTATSVTYNASDMCGSPATDWGWRDPGLLHTAYLQNLTPKKKYYYVFGDYYGWSQEYYFRAAPKVGADVTTTVVAFGDMGCAIEDDSFYIKEDIQPDSLYTTNLIEQIKDNISFVFHIGDISYARGFSAVWDIFFDQIVSFTTNVPYMVCVGNHERNWYDTYPGIFNNSDSGGECGLPHYLRFPMPRAGFDKPWFAFDHGQVHFVVMSTEHDFYQGTEQYHWIANHLANVDRSTTPWLVFTGHRPMYIGSKEDEHVSLGEDLKDALEDMLYTYGVDLAMWAHVHCYQRTCQVYQDECVDGAPVHVVIGMGGRDLAEGAMPDSYEDWMVVSDFETYGFAKLTANSTTLEWEYVHNDDGKTYDYMVLTKNGGSAYIKDDDDGKDDNEDNDDKDDKNEDNDDNDDKNEDNDDNDDKNEDNDDKDDKSEDNEDNDDKNEDNDDNDDKNEDNDDKDDKSEDNEDNDDRNEDNDDKDEDNEDNDDKDDKNEDNEDNDDKNEDNDDKDDKNEDNDVKDDKNEDNDDKDDKNEDNDDKDEDNEDNDDKDDKNEDNDDDNDNRDEDNDDNEDDKNNEDDDDKDDRDNLFDLLANEL